MMNELLIPWILLVGDLDYNFTNFSVDGIFRVAFNPYLVMFGSYFWGMIFGIIGVAIYANERSLGTIAVYLILVGVFIAVIFPEALAGLLGLILAFILAVIFYKAFVEDTI